MPPVVESATRLVGGDRLPLSFTAAAAAATASTAVNHSKPDGAC